MRNCFLFKKRKRCKPPKHAEIVYDIKECTITYYIWIDGVVALLILDRRGCPWWGEILNLFKKNQIYISSSSQFRRKRDCTYVKSLSLVYLTENDPINLKWLSVFLKGQHPLMKDEDEYYLLHRMYNVRFYKLQSSSLSSSLSSI